MIMNHNYILIDSDSNVMSYDKITLYKCDVCNLYKHIYTRGTLYYLHYYGNGESCINDDKNNSCKIRVIKNILS